MLWWRGACRCRAAFYQMPRRLWQLQSRCLRASQSALQPRASWSNQRLHVLPRGTAQYGFPWALRMPALKCCSTGFFHHERILANTFADSRPDFISYHLRQTDVGRVIFILGSGSRFHVLLLNSLTNAIWVITLARAQNRFPSASRRGLQFPICGHLGSSWYLISGCW